VFVAVAVEDVVAADGQVAESMRSMRGGNDRIPDEGNNQRVGDPAPNGNGDRGDVAEGQCLARPRLTARRASVLTLTITAHHAASGRPRRARLPSMSFA